MPGELEFASEKLATPVVLTNWETSVPTAPLGLELDVWASAVNAGDLLASRTGALFGSGSPAKMKFERVSALAWTPEKKKYPVSVWV